MLNDGNSHQLMLLVDGRFVTLSIDGIQLGIKDIGSPLVKMFPKIFRLNVVNFCFEGGMWVTLNAVVYHTYRTTTDGQLRTCVRFTKWCSSSFHAVCVQST